MLRITFLLTVFLTASVLSVTEPPDNDELFTVGEFPANYDESNYYGDVRGENISNKGIRNGDDGEIGINEDDIVHQVTSSIQNDVYNGQIGTNEGNIVNKVTSSIHIDDEGDVYIGTNQKGIIVSAEAKETNDEDPPIKVSIGPAEKVKPIELNQMLSGKEPPENGEVFALDKFPAIHVSGEIREENKSTKSIGNVDTYHDVENYKGQIRINKGDIVKQVTSSYKKDVSNGQLGTNEGDIVNQVTSSYKKDAFNGTSEGDIVKQVTSSYKKDVFNGKIGTNEGNIVNQSASSIKYNDKGNVDVGTNQNEIIVSEEKELNQIFSGKGDYDVGPKQTEEIAEAKEIKDLSKKVSVAPEVKVNNPKELNQTFSGKAANVLTLLCFVENWRVEDEFLDNFQGVDGCLRCFKQVDSSNNLRKAQGVQECFSQFAPHTQQKCGKDIDELTGPDTLRSVLDCMQKSLVTMNYECVMLAQSKLVSAHLEDMGISQDSAVSQCTTFL